MATAKATATATATATAAEMTDHKLHLKIKERFGVPLSTLQDWQKRDADNWRKRMYDHLVEKIKENQ